MKQSYSLWIGRVVRMLCLSGALVLPLSLSAQTETTAITDTAAVAADSDSTEDSLYNRVKQLESQVTTLQEDADAQRIWKRKKYIGFLTGSQTLKDVDAGNEYKSKMAFGFQWDWVHINFHRKPIAKMMMIGMDIALDLNYAQYKDIELTDADIAAGEDDEELLDLGLHQIDAGLAIGPSFQIAPLTSLGGGWRDVKVGLYYHLIPSYSGILIDDGDINVNHSFVLFNSFGIGLTWKALSLGCEWRWGSHKYKNFNYDEDEMDYEDYYDDYISSGENPSIGNFFNTTTEKIKYKTTATRFYIRLNF